MTSSHASTEPVKSQTEHHLRFPSRVSAKVFDLTLEKYTKENNLRRIEGDITFDFSESVFVEPAALQCVIASSRQLLLAGRLPRIRIPRDKKARDFLKSWNFIDALGDAAGKGASELVADEDQGWFEEEQIYYKRSELPSGPNFQGGSLQPRHFFAFSTIRLDKNKQASARPAYAARAHWQSAQVQDILRRKVGRGSSHFPSVVVFEAILNATRHPRAAVIQMASFDQNQTRRSEYDSRVAATTKPPTFTVHFWDDGQSMIQKLREAIQRGVPVRTKFQSDEDFERKYIVDFTDTDPGRTVEYVVSSSVDLGPQIDTHDALLATLFPSVTSSPAGTDNDVAEDVLASDSRFGRPGMGLFVLVHTVAEMLAGTVTIRAGEHIMSVRRASPLERNQHPGATLYARIKRRSASIPSFLGNMITVRVKYSE
jgi:hypothetical protein